MNETGIEKRSSSPIVERGQYALAMGVIALMLWVANFPVFLIFFVGALSFFIWKVFTSEGRHDTRRIFEFYLSANEILRDDDRRWYGFEIQEAVKRGQDIVKSMSSAPPLVHFALGSLYQKAGDHSAAVKHLSLVSDEEAPNEAAIVFPSNELREYVRMLRKIERNPAEAPLTSSAIRSLERARKNKAKDLLEISRAESAKPVPELPVAEPVPASILEAADSQESDNEVRPTRVSFLDKPDRPLFGGEPSRKTRPQSRRSRSPEADRKTISEVLHDIYDRNVS